MKLQAIALMAVMAVMAVTGGRQVATAAPAVSAAKSSAAGSEAIDAYVAQVMAQLHVPGVAIAVVRDGAVEKLGSYGVANLEWQAPVTAQTRFQIASTTKIFTATLVMLLMQEGKLALEAPVSRYLPGAPAAWREVTIGHLAAHTSGIPNLFDPKLGSVAEAYQKVRELPLAYAVGAKASYAGGDFLVLAQVLEQLTRRTFPELLRERIAGPLGMTCTSFEEASDRGVLRSAKVIPQRASTYRWESGESSVSGAGEQQLKWFLYPPYTYAMGGAFSCVDDLVKWAVAMDRGTLLSAASQARAATAFRLGDGSDGGFGVGFSVGAQRGYRKHGHSGGPALGEVLRLPEQKLTIIALTNQQRLHPVLAGSIASLLLPAAAGKLGGAAAIRDGRAEWTKRARAVVGGLGDGSFDAKLLAAAAREGLGASLREWGPVIAGSWAPMERWALVAERKAGERIVRSYRAQHGAIAVRWMISFDAAGLLLDLEASPD